MLDLLLLSWCFLCLFSTTFLWTILSATSTPTTTSCASTAPTAPLSLVLVLLLVDHLVLISEIVFKVDTLFVLKHDPLLLYKFLPLKIVFVIVVVSFKAQQRCNVDIAGATSPRVHDLNVSLHFILGLKRNIAL